MTNRLDACYTIHMNKENRSQIDWHAGFAGGLELSLREYEGLIEIDREYELTKKAPKIDFIVIKKDADIVIDNAVGRLFRKHNIIEYKNPDDALNIDVIWKCIGYTGLYKGLSKKVDAIPESDLTISVFRNRPPLKLFKYCEDNGKGVIHPSPGIYILEGFVSIPLYVIVTKELVEDEFLALRILSEGASESDVRKFVNEARTFRKPGDRNDADAVLQVSTIANHQLYDRMKKENDMCQALKELLKDEIAEEKAESRAEGRAEGREEGRAEGKEEGIEENEIKSIRNLMETLNLSVKDAMNALKISASKQKKYAAMI